MSKIKRKSDLKNIQANILKSNGRNYVRCLFIQFNFDPNQRQGITSWINEFATRITTAHDQIECCKRRRKTSKKSMYDSTFDGKLMTTFSLTNKGYDLLGYSKTKTEADDLPNDNLFWKGLDLEDINNDLFNTDNTILENKYKSEVHALISLADNSLEVLDDEIIKITTEIVQAQIGNILFVENGGKIKVNDKSREHFGYIDGISELQLFDKDYNPDWPDCNKYALENDGSYLVFLKIEQNVEAFNKKIKDLSDKLEIRQDYVGAQIFGRSKEGIPISFLNEQGHIPSLFSKPEIERCPFHAHIRKANYKKNRESVHIFRRGIPYGYRNYDLTDEPKKGVGLLFMCYQKNIENQFVKLQRRFNDENFPERGVGIDPVMGKQKENGKSQRWKIREGELEIRLNFHDEENPQPSIVQILGGKYFFTPSIANLKKLKPKPRSKTKTSPNVKASSRRQTKKDNQKETSSGRSALLDIINKRFG